MNSFAEQATKARDLRTQLGALAQEDNQSILFQEWSPGRKMVKLWSMQDGMEIEVPKYMVPNALMKRYGNGFLFTGNKDEAPLFKEGHLKCFLAEGSPEREAGLLEAAGLDHLAACPAVGLRSGFARRRHGEGVHPQSWAVLQEYLADQDREEGRVEQRKQTEAILALAGSKTAAIEPVTCPTCGKECASDFGLKAHIRAAHKETD